MQQAKGELQQIEEREQELQHLESQIHEVNKLFKEMHVLVGEQGEMVDNIEKYIEEAVDDVEKGNKQLTCFLYIIGLTCPKFVHSFSQFVR
jgi:syntaxin 7